MNTNLPACTLLIQILGQLKLMKLLGHILSFPYLNVLLMLFSPRMPFYFPSAKNSSYTFIQGKVEIRDRFGIKPWKLNKIKLREVSILPE